LILIRVYYILNVLLQIWLLNLFLGTNFLQFGYESIKLFRYGLNQPESKYFPRETFCDFYVREPLRGGEPLQRITVQCVLTVNLFNQVKLKIIYRKNRYKNFYFSKSLLYFGSGLLFYFFLISIR